MKKNTLYLFILLLITGLNTSCNYLDIVPDETATEKDAFANPRAALRYLYSCYGYLPQSNMVQSCMDFTGDETISPFSESYVKFAEGSYDSSNTIISYWNTLFQGIRQCYLIICSDVVRTTNVSTGLPTYLTMQPPDFLPHAIARIMDVPQASLPKA